MKKLTYIILGVIIGAFATYYFCPREVESGHKKIVKPKGVVTPDYAKSLNNNWNKYRKAAVDSASREQGRDIDNRSSWWSLDDIQNYLDFAKNQSDSLGYNMTGVRVYLGVYGKAAGSNKEGYTTMFMVPTGKKSRSEASMSIIKKDDDDDDVPLGSPLNEGIGGGNGYPK